VEKYPQMEFTSTEVRDFDGETFTLVGELTLHGVARTVQLETEFLGVVAGPPAQSAPGSPRPPPSAAPRPASISNSGPAPAMLWSPTLSRSSHGQRIGLAMSNVPPLIVWQVRRMPGLPGSPQRDRGAAGQAADEFCIRRGSAYSANGRNRSKEEF
jgi:hypothetical protein